MSKKGTKRDNIYFRQTPKAFKAAKQTQIFSHINRNLPYRIYNFSKKQFAIQLQRLQKGYMKLRIKLPKEKRGS